MREIVIEPSLSELLLSNADQAILCDPNGRALGFFSPLPDRPPLEELQIEPPLSIEQTQELRKIKTGKPLSEILAKLGLQ